MTIPIFSGVDFASVIEAYAKGAVVRMPALVYFDFRDQPQAVWGGEYDLVAGTPANMVTWKGLGRAGIIAGIKGLGQSSGLDASDITFTLSGVDTAVMTVFKDEDRADYVGRMACVYHVFCDQNWQPYSAPFAVGAGIMGTAIVSRTQTQDGWQRSITLPASNIFAGRGIAPASFYTDRDQQLRSPGDTGLKQIVQLLDYQIPVPWVGGDVPRWK